MLISVCLYHSNIKQPITGGQDLNHCEWNNRTQTQQWDKSHILYLFPKQHNTTDLSICDSGLIHSTYDTIDSNKYLTPNWEGKEKKSLFIICFPFTFAISSLDLRGWWWWWTVQCWLGLQDEDDTLQWPGMELGWSTRYQRQRFLFSVEVLVLINSSDLMGKIKPLRLWSRNSSAVTNKSQLEESQQVQSIRAVWERAFHFKAFIHEWLFSFSKTDTCILIQHCSQTLSRLSFRAK